MTYSKAQKLKAKRGRPKKVGVIRESNGRISRAKEPPSRVALEARAKHNGLSITQAIDPRSGTYLGRLALRGNRDGLSDQQYEDAMRFRELRNEYRKAHHSRDAHYEPGLGDGDYDAYQRWVENTIKRHNDVMELIREEQNRTRSLNLYAALEHVLVDDLPLDYMIGSVRILCNLLSKHFTNVDRTGKVRNK